MSWREEEPAAGWHALLQHIKLFYPFPQSIKYPINILTQFLRTAVTWRMSRNLKCVRGKPPTQPTSIYWHKTSGKWRRQKNEDLASSASTFLDVATKNLRRKMTKMATWHQRICLRRSSHFDNKAQLP
jgi:hypothetical protein